jgi:hypothetical protein
MTSKTGENPGSPPALLLIQTIFLLLMCTPSHAQSAPSPAPTSPPASITAPPDIAGPLTSDVLRTLSDSPYPLQAEPSPPAIRLEHGMLSVAAHNSDLVQILQEIARLSGMTIEVEARGPRIYGVYGPGPLPDILSSLLIGSGFNFVMIGRSPQGGPRALFLTPRLAIDASPQPPPPDDEDPAQDMDGERSRYDTPPDGEASVPIQPQNTIRSRRILNLIEATRGQHANPPQ